jgi:hypothetical protein
LDFEFMRVIKLTGREASVVRAIGYCDSMLGADLLDRTGIDVEDLTDCLNGLISAGFVESIPYCEDVSMADMPGMAFEVNPAYSQDLTKAARKGF